MGLLLAVATLAVVGGLWVLDHLDFLPTSTASKLLGRLAIVPILLSIYLAPSAFQSGFEWFVERKTDQVLEQIEHLISVPDPDAPPADR